MEGPLPQRNGALPPLALLEEGEETRGSAEKVGREESRRREEGWKEGRREEGGKKRGREWEGGREEGGREKGEVRKDKEGRREGGTQNKGRNMAVPSIQQSHFWPFFFVLFPTTLIHTCTPTTLGNQLICNGPVTQ